MRLWLARDDEDGGITRRVKGSYSRYSLWRRMPVLGLDGLWMPTQDERDCDRENQSCIYVFREKPEGITLRPGTYEAVRMGIK